MANLWSGRFENEMDELLVEFNESVSFSIRMYSQDIMGSIAHATMLAKNGIITNNERDTIVEGLKDIMKRIGNGQLKFTAKTEDIHMSVEEELIKITGDTGRKLHTARSRNDQGVLDSRMYLRDEIKDIFYLLKELQNVIIERAEENKEQIMPSFTHLQHAQPATIGFHMMAYFNQFKRDMERLISCYERVDYCPLGACALAGTTFPIDRHYVAELLNFKNVTENAMDSVSDRDYIMEFISFASICMVHLSRFSEEFTIWSTQEFGFIDIDDSFCTGSSIMPQKKNPDVPELIRGKSGRVFGNLITILTAAKGIPMAYNKDLQEDKEALYDTIDTLKICIKIFANMLKKTDFKYERIKEHMSKGFLNATDLAESFAMQGIPFRTAHGLVGKVVKYCENKDINLENINGTDLKLIDERLIDIKLPDLSNLACVLRRNSYGGTSPKEVARQIESARRFLDKDPFKE